MSEMLIAPEQNLKAFGYGQLEAVHKPSQYSRHYQFENGDELFPYRQTHAGILLRSDMSQEELAGYERQNEIHYELYNGFLHSDFSAPQYEIKEINDAFDLIEEQTKESSSRDEAQIALNALKAIVTKDIVSDLHQRATDLTEKISELPRPFWLAISGGDGIACAAKLKGITVVGTELKPVVANKVGKKGILAKGIKLYPFPLHYRLEKSK